MVKIPIGRGEFAIVDDCDFDLLLSYCWNKEKKGIIRAKIKGKMIQLSRLIGQRMGFDPAKLVDHKDLNKLNNCRSNLREATDCQNKANSFVRKCNPTGLKGAYLVNGKYLSAIGVNGKTIHLGTFKTAEEANAAYGRAAVKYFGEFANW